MTKTKNKIIKLYLIILIIYFVFNMIFKTEKYSDIIV
jgi:hypothetical protein